MKSFLLLTVFLGCLAGAHPRYGSAVDYRFGHTYAVVAATDEKVFLELRAYDGDRVVDKVVLSSRYMPPDLQARDLASDENPEFIIRTRDGGTGFAETRLFIYGVAGGHFRRLGEFVEDRSAESWPSSEYSERLTGKVSFPKKGQLIYQYTQTVTKTGRTTIKAANEVFSFDQKQCRYEQVKKP